MEKIIELIKASRTKLLSLVEELTTEEMNYIPTGFKNNLAWQIGHLVVSQQILCYKLAGQPFVIEDELIDLYKNGSKPERDFSAAE
ncbi:MAG: DinB family protein, partial [Pedobacter sp.]